MMDAKRLEQLMSLDDTMCAGDDTPSMYRLMEFVERLEKLVLYDATMTADDAREIKELGIGEIDVKRQRFLLSPQFGAVVRRKTAN
jgi:hypothetical protein